MRIRRRATDVLHHAQAASSSQTRSLAAAAPSSAPRAPAPCSETDVVPRVQPPACEVDRSMCEAKPFGPRRPSRGWNRQEEGGNATGDEKRGKEDGRSEHERGRTVHVVCSTRAAPKGEEEERSAEVGENKSEDSGRVKDEGKAAAMCKKGDGKGWHCKRVAQCGYSLCQYHLDKLRSYGCYSQKKKKRPKAASATERATAAGVHRQVASEKENKKKRTMEEHVPSTGPGVSDSFYYYSGFGPRWGKRRGDRSVDVVKVSDGGASQVHQDMGDAAAAAVAGGEEDEYDCDGSSRDGKPLKSRALSSLL